MKVSVFAREWRRWSRASGDREGRGRWGSPPLIIFPQIAYASGVPSDFVERRRANLSFATDRDYFSFPIQLLLFIRWVPRSSAADAASGRDITDFKASPCYLLSLQLSPTLISPPTSALSLISVSHSDGSP